MIGSGSWGTAIIKMLSENISSINWWVRNKETLNYIKSYNKNPKYLSNVELNLSKLRLSSDINEVFKSSDYLILAVPSSFLNSSLKNITCDIKNKVVFSAIKGIVPEKNIIVGDYIHNFLNIPYHNIGVITGPCHAEEVALERLSYLTIACSNLKNADFFSKKISSKYINTSISDDIYGTEYSSILKNIIAIAVGISRGLGYGDNFQAVLVSNAIQEISRFVNAVHPISRDINESAYLGDLMVTCYSQFSRNRVFGEMIGMGSDIKSAQVNLKMIAEGYHSVKCIHEVNQSLSVKMPIINAVYNILYQNASPKNQIKILSNKIS